MSNKQNPGWPFRGLARIRRKLGIEAKSLNSGYNSSFNRRKAEITFDPHLFNRKEYRNLDLSKIEETVRAGKIFDEKCKWPNKICFNKHFGKENVTYTVMVRYHQDFIEVKTAWPKKGR